MHIFQALFDHVWICQRKMYFLRVFWVDRVPEWDQISSISHSTQQGLLWISIETPGIITDSILKLSHSLTVQIWKGWISSSSYYIYRTLLLNVKYRSMPVNTDQIISSDFSMLSIFIDSSLGLISGFWSVLINLGHWPGKQHWTCLKTF